MINKSNLHRGTNLGGLVETTAPPKRFRCSNQDALDAKLARTRAGTAADSICETDSSSFVLMTSDASGMIAAIYCTTVELSAGNEITLNL